MDIQRIIDTIDGNIQGQGVKVRFPAWMVIGSPEWEVTPDQIRSYAYQASLATGWKKESLISTVCSAYSHIDLHMANFTISLLEDLAKEYPLQVEDKKKERPKVTIIDGHGLSRSL